MLLLILYFHFDLLHCDEFGKAYSNGPLRIKHEETTNHNVMDNITDIMWNSTPGIVQTNWISPQYSFLPTPIDHETYIQSVTGPTPTDRFPQANRRNQKVTQRKISSRQLKNNAFRDQPRHQLHQRVTLLEIYKRRNPGSKPKASSYDSVRRSKKPALHKSKRSQTRLMGTKKRLFPNLLLSDGMAIKGDAATSDDDDKFEKVIQQMDPGEEIMPMGDIMKLPWYSDQTETPTATTTRQYLRQKADTHSYFAMIETLQEGYMMVFLIELTRLVATKEWTAVRDVVQHTDQIVYGLHHSGQLLWFGESLISVTRKVARFLTESEIDVIQNYAAYLHHMLIQRHQALSVEVNTILEYADMLYDDDEGRLLFDALKQFAAYPNIRITGYWLCSSLIHNFLRPYRRLKDTQQRQELIDSVNIVLKSYEKTPLRSGDVRQADDPPDENPSSTQTEPYSDTTRSPRKQKRKRHHRSHKKKRQRKRHRIHRYKPEYIQTYDKQRNLGSMSQRTSVQSRFKIKTKSS